MTARTMGDVTREPRPAIGYIRVSLAREEMISPELQRSAVLQWAARTNHRIVDWVEDLDKTGRNFKRRIMRAVERVESGEAEVIAVWKYSRFGRSREGITINLARVERAGGELLSATEDVDASTAVGKLQRGMIFEFGAFESDRAGEQWIETHQWRRDHGLPATGRPRFGYIWHPRRIMLPSGLLQMQREYYEPDPTITGAVIDIYHRYISGTGFRKLSQLLNEDGRRTTTGGFWAEASLSNYMDSGFAAGYLRVHNPACKVTPYKSTCPRHEYYRHPEHGHAPIIDEAVWQAYLQRRAMVKTLPPRARAAAHPLTGLIVCGCCGYRAKRMYGQKRISRFVCAERRNKGPLACDGQIRSSKVLLGEIFTWVEGVANHVHLRALEVEAGQDEAVSARELRARKRAHLETSLAAMERAIRRHMKAFAMASDDELEDEFLATLAEMRQEKARIGVELAALDAKEGGKVEKQMAAAIPVAEGLLEEWDSLEPAGINALLRQLIRAVVMERDGSIRIEPTWAPAT